MRHHLRTVQRLNKTSDTLDGIQYVRKSVKPIPMAKATVKLQKQTLKYKPPISTTGYIHRQTLPKNKRTFPWAYQPVTVPSPPAKIKKFTAKPIKTLPVCHPRISTPSTSAVTVALPVRTPTKHSPTEDLQDLTWLVHALEDPPSTIHTPMAFTTPQQEWITLDSVGDTDFHQLMPSEHF